MKKASDYITRLQKSSLFQRLEAPESKKGVLEVFELSRIMLKKGDEVFFNFTSHDIGHAVRTLESFCILIEHSNALHKLTEGELVISICACLLHDVGMGPLSTIEIGEATSDGITPEKRETWRASHHERVSEWLLESNNLTFDFLDQDALECVAQVVRAHRKVNLYSDGFMVSNPRIAYLSAVLRLADQMDLSPARIEERLINRDVIRILLEKAETSDEKKQAIEFLKSFAEKEWYLELEGGENLIILNSRLALDDLTLLTLEALEELIYDIELTIEQTKNVPFQGVYPLPRRLEFSFSVSNEVSNRHKLRADFGRVWEYLNVYLYPKNIRESIAIREVVTNAIDACRIQQVMDPDTDYSVIARWEEDRIIVRDNGAGMTLEVIEDHFKVLGSSYYDSPLFKGNPLLERQEDLPIIGQFGIGVFSYLLICDSFEVLSSTGPGKTYRILVSRRFGVTTRTKDIPSLEHGTIVVLPRPQHYSKSIWSNPQQLKHELSRTFLFPAIPLVFEYGDTVSTVGRVLPKPVQRITSSDDRVELEICDTSDIYNHNIGFHMRTTLVGKWPLTKPFDILKLHNWLWSNHRYIRDPLMTLTIATYEGMSLPDARIAAPPFLLALHALTRIGRSRLEDDELQLTSWINFKAGSVKLNLPKMNIIGFDHTRRYAGEQVEELDRICMEHCLILLEHPEVCIFHKEVLRIVIAEGLISWGIGYLIALGSMSRVIGTVLLPLVCIDGKRLQYTTLDELLRKPKGSKMVLLQSMHLFNSYMDYDLVARVVLSFKDIVMRRDKALSAARAQMKMDRLKPEYDDFDVYYVMAGDYQGSSFFLRLMKAAGFTNVAGRDAILSRW